MRISIGPWAVFIIGFGVGVLTTQSFFRDKYQKKADEDIASVVEHFESRYGVKKKKKTVSDNDETEASQVKTKSSMDLGDKSAKTQSISITQKLKSTNLKQGSIRKKMTTRNRLIHMRSASTTT